MTHLPRLGRFLGLLGAVTLAGYALFRAGPHFAAPEAWPPEDFIAFWSAGRIFLAGGNPYSWAELGPVQWQAGWPVSKGPLDLYNPPWGLTFFLPFCVFNFASGRLLWLLFQLGTLFLCAEGLRRLYASRNGTSTWPILICFAYYPTLQLLAVSQTTFLVLAGIVGFLVCHRHGHEFLAGGWLAITGVKPHLAVLPMAAVTGWAVVSRRWRILWGLWAVGALLLALPALWNPAAYAHYLEAMTTRPPRTVPAVPAAWLRQLIDPDAYWLQLVPTFLGLVWVTIDAIRQPSLSSWDEKMSGLLFVTVLTAAYGWGYDLVVLLPPLVEATASLPRWPRPAAALAAAGYLAGNAAAVVMNVQHVDERYFVWLAPALLGGWIMGRWLARPQEAAPPARRPTAEGRKP
ncbi:MAG: DUF2029 domain-containing protein [Gemmataceae bacterium]|nr:DUF2029 domain-containing protein [Gemmataceae bacterium]MDW8265996.1 glycosyltransferase family 87 protein [Gemmataceae bacterium]